MIIRIYNGVCLQKSTESGVRKWGRIKVLFEAGTAIQPEEPEMPESLQCQGPWEAKLCIKINVLVIT